jgi:hypothetical protein
VQIHSGYKTITAIQWANAIWALNERLIDHRGLRVYLASLSMVAVREAAQRYRRKRREKVRDCSRYQLHELERLTGLDGAKARRALRQLERAGLMTLSEGEVDVCREPLLGSEELQSAVSCRRSPRRPIPVPRSMLRFLAQNRSEALAKVIIAYVVRGLAITRSTGIVSAKGTVKASWIADTFGLSQRAVKYAQAELRALNWISKDTQSVQRKLNRDGAYFVINLAWTRRVGTMVDGSELKEIQIVNRDKLHTSFAPPLAKITPPFAPPIEDQETSIEKDQYRKTQSAGARRSGVCGEEKAGSMLPEPSLRDILQEDLYQFGRLESLYFQALEWGWLDRSEAMALNFIAAAVKAREEGNDPARLFVSLVRRGLWHHINQKHEDRARAALTHYREGNPERFYSSSSRCSRRSDGLLAA